MVYFNLAKEFPDRYYNIGICEPSMINIGAGMSKVGLIPVTYYRSIYCRKIL